MSDDGLCGERGPGQLGPWTSTRTDDERAEAEAEQRYRTMTGMNEPIEDRAARARRNAQRTPRLDVTAAVRAALVEAADEIEAELICCDVFERRDQTQRSHSICYWGGAARQLVLDKVAALDATPSRDDWSDLG